MLLTEKTIAKLKAPAEGHSIAYDDAHPGFGVRITAGGVVAFVLDYRMPGEKEKHRITIGRFPEISLRRAREKAKELQVEIRGGSDPLAPPPAPPVGRTVADLLAEYLDKHALKNNRPNTVRNARVHIALVNSRIGTCSVDSVTREQIEGLRVELQSTPTQANRIRSTLSKAFALAVEWGWRSDNPARGVRKYQETPRELWLTPEQLGRVFAELDKYPDQNTAAAIRLIVLTGARKGEVLSARWEDFEGGRWRKPSHHTKQKKTEHVPLSADAIALLDKLRKETEGTGWLFPGKNGEHLGDVKKAWEKIRLAAKLATHPLWGDVRPHDLRHTFGSLLASSGESLQTIGKLLGHTQASTTQRYAHLSDQALRSAANRFSKLAGGRK